jgi:MarR family transcriptional regulator for hemolysin
MCHKIRDANGKLICNPDPANQHRVEQGELLYLVHEISRMVSTYFDQAMEKHQLTRAQWWCMMHVSENEGLSQSELAEKMQMGRASAGKLIERLEAKGWLERRNDETDNRLRRVYVSEQYHGIAGMMDGESSQLYRDILAGVSRTEHKAILTGMRKIKQNADQHLAHKDDH